MKKTLLFMLMGLISITSTANAQISMPKTWDFANDTANWPLSAGTGVPEKTVDQLGLFSKSDGSITNFAAITATSYTFSDGYTGANRLQLNGAGYTSSTGFVPLPTQRYMYFDVTGTATVTVWFRSGSNSSSRTVFVTNGSTVLGQAATDTAGTGVIFTANKTSSGNERLYVFADASCNIYKITVTGATMATGDINNAGTKVFANGSEVRVSNITTATDISVYSMTGGLVKSLQANSDVAFTLKTGVYIVNTKSTKGVKSQKVSVK